MLRTILVQLRAWQRTVEISDKRLVKTNLIYKNIGQKKHENDNKNLER